MIEVCKARHFMSGLVKHLIIPGLLCQRQTIFVQFTMSASGHKDVTFNLLLSINQIFESIVQLIERVLRVPCFNFA